MKVWIRNLVLIVAVVSASGLHARGTDTVSTIGRGICTLSDGVYSTCGAYTLVGDPGLSDYTLKFKARSPQGCGQVQIWAGVRTANRFDRYVVGIKGGLQDDLYLMRTGYMGMDEFMGVRPLGFHPVPGEWYDVKVEVCGDRIRVFLNGEDIPRMDITDKHASLAPCGAAAIGGGWLPAEYKDVSVTPLDSNALSKVAVAEKSFLSSAADKEKLRTVQREAYAPVKVTTLRPGRNEINLDGNWLFMPGYQISDACTAASPSVSDGNWHVMNVPDFWNPIRIWLHGETMSSPTGPQAKGVSDTYYQRETERCENYTFDYRKTSYAWYRQWVELPHDIKGRKMVLAFDAVSKSADVYVNGHLVGTHLGMFSDFEMDVTPFMKPGKNLITVGVARNLNGEAGSGNAAMENYYASVRKEAEDNKNDVTANAKQISDVPHGFYQDHPAGIWQPVKLVVTNPVKIEDVIIHPSLTGADFDVNVSGNIGKGYRVELTVTDVADGSKLYDGILGTTQGTNLKSGISELTPKLWSPEHPNLYDFKFALLDKKGRELDSKTITSGFRTFESRDGFLWLNGRKYWLKGGNHIPFALCPNDSALAKKFMAIMREGNINSTRTHTTPWNELWVSEADRSGIAISFEGTWPWLMIHSTPIPEQADLDLWREEWLQVMKKYRNHPSVVFWTVNNEMKFYDLDADDERAKQKFSIVSDVVKLMREVDPTRPVCFDSNYLHKKATKRFGKDFVSTMDDGDIDDQHAYYNWYDFSLFRFFNGEFQRDFKSEGRPLISQEMSTGYPNNETGHPTRSYQLIHQNPFTLIGYDAYDWSDPNIFLKVQGFITGELAEALRRSNPEASGIMHFAYMTWLRQCYDAENIAPYPAWYAMQRAMQPVLVSAELWGRHFYAGSKISPRIYVVNDDVDGKNLHNLTLRWSIEDRDGKTMAAGSESMKDVPYYDRTYIAPTIKIPDDLPESRMDGCLHLVLTDGSGSAISENRYEITIASPEWIGEYATDGVKVIDGVKDFKPEYAQELRAYHDEGGKMLLLNCPELAKAVFPEYITGWQVPTEGDIVVMERPEADVFDGLDVLDLRYFNNNKREIPTACHSILHVKRNEHIEELASQMKIHAYLDDKNLEDRVQRIEAMRGLTLMAVDGHTFVSTMATDKASTDPVAGKLLANLVNKLNRR